MTHKLQRLLVKCWSASASGEQLTTSLIPACYHLSLKEMKKKQLQKSASSCCCCIWLGLHKRPECSAKDCARAQRGWEQGGPILWERSPSVSTLPS